MNNETKNVLGTFAAYEAIKDAFNHVAGFVTFVALLIGLKSNSKKVRNTAFAIGIISAIDEIRMFTVALRSRKNALEMCDKPDEVKEATSVKNMLDFESKENWKHQMGIE